VFVPVVVTAPWGSAGEWDGGNSPACREWGPAEVVWLAPLADAKRALEGHAQAAARGGVRPGLGLALGAGLWERVCRPGYGS